MRFAVVAVLLAYVMPPYSVLRRMADERDKLELNALKVDGTATAPQTVAADYANALGVTAGPLTDLFTTAATQVGAIR